MMLALRLVLVCLAFLGQTAYAHGGVVADGDLCIIKVNYLRGHFKIYQPRIDGHKEYCEDLPNATESVFVMEYLHNGLGKASVDFRIIRDVTGQGRFARWEDIAEIEDLDGATVFYREPRIDPDVFTAVHEFAEEGAYIGIVTANVDGEQRIYRAVFPFEVGFTGLGYWPLFIVLMLVVQIQYLISSGRLARWRQWRRARSPDLTTVLLLVWFAPMLWAAETRADDADEWVSKRGIYVLSVDSSLEPIKINQIHTWLLRITEGDKPVVAAVLTVNGGMPAHDHGLPTRPRVTEELGQGSYRLEGMRFHMHGDWEVSIEIAADGKTDIVIVALHL